MKGLVVEPVVRFLIGLVAVPLLALALVAGCSSDPPPAADQGERPVTSAKAPSIPEQQQAPGAPVVAGYTVSVPRLGVRSSLVSLGLNPDRTVQVPALNQPQQVGHYRGSPLPGAVGPSVLLGHVNGRIDGKAIPGAFAKLASLAAGDRIDVAVPDGLATRTVRFVVYRVETMPKEGFKTAAVYGDTDGPELRLITCGGDYDPTHRNYLSNVVAFARLAS